VTGGDTAAVAGEMVGGGLSSCLAEHATHALIITIATTL